MGTAVISLMAFIIVLAAAFTALGDLVGLTVISSQSLRSSWREAERFVDSSVIPISASVSGTDVDIVISNRGRLKYAEPELEDWEVVIRYDDTGGTSHVEYLDYSSVLAAGNWTVQQIYLEQSTSTVEIYELDILNSEEEMVIRARLANTPGTPSLNQVTVSPPEGGSGTVHFNG